VRRPGALLEVELPEIERLADHLAPAPPALEAGAA
jgi:hypothetical protein